MFRYTLEMYIGESWQLSTSYKCGIIGILLLKQMVSDLLAFLSSSIADWFTKDVGVILAWKGGIYNYTPLLINK